MARTLTHKGHEVETVESVREGIRALADSAFDLVITDMYMPDADGLDCLRQIRELSPSTPVIVMSGQLVGSFGIALKSMVKLVGAAGAISKSADITELLALIESVARTRAA